MIYLLCQKGLLSLEITKAAIQIHYYEKYHTTRANNKM